ncbi:MAG: hypothetical protein E6I32_11690 [Chloroflexi bacterium]|nr:MAG: hypothetical protein E6I32_11690 [Chloroflexota bacterium]
MIVHYIKCYCDTGWVSLLVKYIITCNEIAHALPTSWRWNRSVYVKRLSCSRTRFYDGVLFLRQGPGDLSCHLNLRSSLFVSTQAFRENTALAQVGGDGFVQIGDAPG